MTPLVSAAIAALFLIVPTAAAADMAKTGDLIIQNAWSRATSPIAKAGAAYVSIFNAGSAPDRLVAAESDIAGKVELHTHIVEDGIAVMRPVEGGIDLPPNETVVLKPMGPHVMLMGLKRPLTEGETFRITLMFETAAPVFVGVTIAKAGASNPAHSH